MRDFLKRLILAVLILILVVSSVSAISNEPYLVYGSHVNGTQGSTTIIDETGNASTMTNNAYIDTNIKQFGSASLALDGVGDRAEGTDGNGYILPADFTIDGWFNLNGTVTNNYVFGLSGNTTDRVRLRLVSQTSIAFNCGANTSTVTPTFYINKDMFYKFAAVRSGSECALYINGTKQTSVITGDILSRHGTAIGWGTASKSTAGSFDGFLDELRVLNGYADTTWPVTSEYNWYTSPANPPPSIMNLSNSSTTCNSTHVDWLNPGDLSNFNHTAFWRNDNPFYNATNTTTTFTDSGLSEHTWYNYSTRTANMEGAMNATWVNVSVFTQSCTIPVTAAFSCAPTSGNAPGFLTTCTDSSTGSPDTWYWEFGDGNTSVAQNPTNTYGWAGLFNVSLHASKAGSDDWENKTAYINVTWAANVTPVPTYPSRGSAGSSIMPQDWLGPETVMMASLSSGIVGGIIGGLIVWGRKSQPP